VDVSLVEVLAELLVELLVKVMVNELAEFVVVVEL
jgi:hypothetical protein